MINPVKLVSPVITLAMVVLIARGAYWLTGSAPLTLALTALVPVQWAFALIAIRSLQTPLSVGRFLKALGAGAVWLVMATIGVSFSAAELFRILGAEGTAVHRFDAEQDRLRNRARDIATGMAGIRSLVQQYVEHAQAMAALEGQRGGSCAVTLGGGRGDIHQFRQADARAAALMAGQIEPRLDAMSTTLKTVQQMRFDGPVADLRRHLGATVADTNAVANLPLWAEIQDFAKTSSATAQAISTPKGAFQCADAARQMLLDQLAFGARRMAATPPLPEPQLVDPTDLRALTMATMVRTWAGVLAILPEKLWQGRPLLSTAFKTRYTGEEAAVIDEGRVHYIVAWILELLLVLVLASSVAGRAVDEPADLGSRAGRWVLTRLSRRGGVLADVIGALRQPLPEELAPAMRRVDGARLFSDAAMEARASHIATWYVPWGQRDMVVVPMYEPGAVRACRELARAKLLRSVVTAVPTAALLREKDLAVAMQAIGGESLPDTAWIVSEVTDDTFLRWLLAQPVHAAPPPARLALPEAA